jgi:iron complex outermembrane receptor protein
MTRLALSLALCFSLPQPTVARSDPPQAPAAGKPAETRTTSGEAAPTPPRVSEEVTVTAKPILEGIRVDSLAGTIATVGRTQIDDLNAQDVASALRRVPGMAISRYNPVGSYGGGDGGAVFVRGQGAGRPGAEIATMVDGVAKFVGVWTHPLLDLLSVDLVHQVDVYKGAQPVLLGNMAFATVDLVSRRRATPGLGARVTAAYGSFGTSAFRLLQEGRKGRLDWLVSASHRQSDGHRENADGRTRAVFSRAGFALAPGWDLSLTLDLSDGHAHDPGVEGAAATAVTPRFRSSDGMGILTLTRRHGGKAGSLKLYVDDGSIDWLQWDAAKLEGFSTLTDWKNYGLKAQERFAVLGGGEVTVGFDVDAYGGRSREEWPVGPKPLGDFRFRNTAAYAGYQHTFGDRVRITPSAGVRYTDSRDFGGQWGGQAGVGVSGGFGQAHLRWAHAFNLPGVWTAAFYQGYGRGEEWLSLEPERMDHFELGYTRAFGARARVDFVLFRDDVENALRFVAPPPPPPSFANTGSYRASGVEASFTLEPLAGLCLMAGLTGMDTNPSEIPYAPGATWIAGAVYARGRLRVSLDAQRVGETWVGNLRYPAPLKAVDPFFLLNGRVGWRLGEKARGAEVYVAGENLTDSAYQYRPGYPMPGGSLMGGVAWGF